MTPEKIVSVIEIYERRLKTGGIPKRRMSIQRTFGNLSSAEALAHAYSLCDGAKEYAHDPEHQGKANRHLTAIQMCLSLANWYTLGELMEHNRPS